jgi:hypothetical protein
MVSEGGVPQVPSPGIEVDVVDVDVESDVLVDEVEFVLVAVWLLL